MKHLIYITLALLGLVSTVKAQPVVYGVSANECKIERQGQYMTVKMTLDLSHLHVSSNRAIVLTPRLINGTYSLDLPSVGIYGRRRYYFYVRNGLSLLTGKEEESYKASQMPDRISYNKVIPYKEWMSGATLSLYRYDYGCCNTLVAEENGRLGGYRIATDFLPELVYVRPQAEATKSRALEGSANIDFPVNRTEIYPNYRYNATELGKIQATINSVRNDPDATITSIWLKGYASPEGSYEHNRTLAYGRTEALKRYLRQFYRFPEHILSTDYEPEDWAGLRRYVEQSEIPRRWEILAIINSDMNPDAKEGRIRYAYPMEYRFLLTNCYPALRHTDYRIAYNIRSYSDVEEIRRVMRSQPQKLSLNEFYVLAQECQPGTAEFTEIFETAVRMYPNDAIANLNAANAAAQRNDLAAAGRYLTKAGNSPEAAYARGVVAFLAKDYDIARQWLDIAKKNGMKQAAAVLEELDRRAH